MKQFLGILFLILGGLFLFKILTQGWVLFLLLALCLAAASATGATGRWGYSAAALLLLLGLPGLFIQSLAVLLALAARLAPALLILFGIYLLASR